MDLTRVKDYFQQKLIQYGPTAEGMDWSGVDSQRLRFKMIAKYMDFQGVPSVLDVGCGAGAFLDYCRDNHLQIKYTGLDIVPTSVEHVNAKFGPNTARLGTVMDILPDQYFDYVIASGTFNAKLDTSASDWRTFFYDSVLLMSQRSKHSVIFNCMSQFVSWEYERLYYPNLSDLCGFISDSISRSFVVDHSYPLYECTIAIKKHAD